MPHPFRFGVQFSTLPGREWADTVERWESLGYSSVFCPDHFSPQWEPTTALAAIAAATRRLVVGSLVYDVDYRHPVVLAKASATLQLLSGGRHEFGIGAGWMRSDYEEAGLAYDRPGVRIDRLEEAIRIIRAMWTQERSSFDGEHYRVRDIARAVDLGDVPPPRVLIGGGGPRILALAGRHADIVGINPTLPEGRVTAQTTADLSAERVREKVRWAREGAEGAGRDPDALELNSLVFGVAITSDPKPVREVLGKGTGLSADEIAESALFLTGSPAEIQDRLQQRREATGIGYIVVQASDAEQLEQFAEHVVQPLAGR